MSIVGPWISEDPWPCASSRRERRVGDQMASLGIDLQCVEEEQRRAVDHRIDAFEIRPVEVVLVVLPEVRAQPGAARGPQAPQRAVDRRGGPPQVGVVMANPAARAVHAMRGHRPRNREILDHPDQRLDALGEGGDLGRPIVHLGVDVDRVLAAPGRRDLVVPYALEVGGLAAGARRRDQQVAAIVEIKRGERRVVRIARLPDAQVGGKIRRGRAAEIDSDAPIEAAMLRGRRVGDRREAFGQRGGDPGACALVGLTADVVEAPIAGGHGYEQHQFVSVLNHQRIAFAGHPSAAHDRFQPRLETQRAGDIAVRVVVPRQDEGVAAFGCGLPALEGAGEGQAAGNRTASVRAQPHRDHLVDRRGQHLAAIARVRRGEIGDGDRGIEIERTSVVLRRRRGDLGHFDQQAADGLVCRLDQRPRHHPFVGEGFGLGVAVAEDELAEPLHAGRGFRIDRIIRPAGPQGVLVQLQPLGDGSAEHHGAHAAVADRQCLDPRRGRSAIPQFVVRTSCPCPCPGLRGGPGGERGSRGEQAAAVGPEPVPPLHSGLVSRPAGLRAARRSASIPTVRRTAHKARKPRSAGTRAGGRSGRRAIPGTPPAHRRQSP